MPEGFLPLAPVSDRWKYPAQSCSPCLGMGTTAGDPQTLRHLPGLPGAPMAQNPPETPMVVSLCPSCTTAVPTSHGPTSLEIPAAQGFSCPILPAPWDPL